jgi:nucleoside permease NupC
MSDAEIKKSIDGLNISADAKQFLYTFSKATIQAGEFVLKIGRKIIDFVCMVYREHPGATFGLIFGAIAGFLIAAIPIIGFVLGPLFTPIAMALGLVVGAVDDLKDKELSRKIQTINAEFSPLNA